MVTICFLFPFFGEMAAYAQHQVKADSLAAVLYHTTDVKEKVSILNQLAFYYKDINARKGLEYARKAVNLAKNTDNEIGISYGYKNIGLNYFSLGDYKNALGYYLDALDIAERIGHKRASATIMLDIAILYGNQGHYDRSLDYFLKALALYEEIQSIPETALTFGNIGIVYLRLKDYDQAEKYLLKASEMNEKMANAQYEGAVDVLGNLGSLYLKIGNYEKSEYYYKQILEKEKGKVKNATLLDVYFNLAKSYLSQNRFEEAKYYLDKGLEISKDQDDKFMIAEYYGGLGELYLKMGSDGSSNSHKLLNEAVLHLKKAVDLFDEMNANDGYQKTTKLLSDAYLQRGDYKNAHYFFREHSIYKDSLFNEEKTKELTRLEMRYEFSKKEETVKKENAIRENELKAKKKQTWIFGIGLLVVTLLGILLFYQNQLKNKKNKELDEANRIKTRFFSILNHDLRSPVTELIRFLYLKKEDPDFLDVETIERLDNQTIKTAENLLVSMDDLLLWSKGQMENFKPQPENILIDNIFKYLRRFFPGKENITVVFENPQNIELFTDENYLKTIMRNLTSNAVKALANTENAKITWRAYRENNKTVLSITDNGPGGTDEQFRALYDEKEVVGIKTGLGLHLVRDMAEAIGCKVEVNTLLGGGTTINLVFD